MNSIKNAWAQIKIQNLISLILGCIVRDSDSNLMEQIELEVKLNFYKKSILKDRFWQFLG